MDQPVSTTANHLVWDSRSLSATVSLLIEGSEWDQLLNRLGLTDVEALAAVREGREAGQPIASFVREEFRERFVPEDVLLAVTRRWKATQENSLIFGSFLGN